MSVGSQIRHAREAAGLSLADLADLTKIRSSVLEAMERDDFSAAGGEIYVRMQLRTVASVLGVDPEQFTRAYSDDTQPIPVQSVSKRREPDPDRDSSGFGLVSLGGIDRLLRRRNGANWTAAMLVAVVGLVAVVIAVVLLGRDRGMAAAGDLMPSAPVVSVAPSPTPVPDAGNQRTDDTVVVSGGVTVIVEGIGDRSWVSVTGDGGESLFDGLVLLGEKKTFRDPARVTVAMGNAGAVALTVNGTVLGSAGAEGEVRSLEFTPGQPTVSLR